MYLETVYFLYIEDITLLGQNLDIKHFNMKYFCESYGFKQNFCRVLQKIVLCDFRRDDCCNHADRVSETNLNLCCTKIS